VKRLALGISVLAMAIYSCGGSAGDSGTGSASVGFYDLSLSVIPSYILSPASADGPTIPPDEFTVSLQLAYTGTNERPLRGFIKKSELCIGSKCYNLGLSGVLQAGSNLERNVTLNAHKYNPPWIVLNPYEDEVYDTIYVTDTISGGVKQDTYQDRYQNSKRSLVLPYRPILAGWLTIESQAGETFSYSLTYPGYETTDGTVTVNLPKGTVNTNTIVASSVKITVGSTVCVDDGSGNIVQQGGGGDCSGTIDYNTGKLQFSVLNINSPTDAVIEYRFSGQLKCWDDAKGNVVGDCKDTSKVNYETGELTYEFRYAFVNVPADITITYKYASGSPDGVTYFYELPPDRADETQPFLKYKFGREIEVYLGTDLACSLNVQTLCTIEKQGTKVKIVFNAPPQQDITIKYSQDKVYDFNPNVNAKEYNHLWNGQSSAVVDGSVNVEVKLEDGTSLKASVPVTFEVVPR